jgi:hypothetical protein
MTMNLAGEDCHGSTSGREEVVLDARPFRGSSNRL